MKFGQLPVGGRFSHRGEIYLKDSPLQAKRESDNDTKLIPRSAVITPLDTGSLAIAAELPARIERARVEHALDALRTELTTALARIEPTLDANQQQQLHAAITSSRERFLKRLAPD